MGIKDIIKMASKGSRRKGTECVNNPDGTRTCARIERDNEGNVMSSGSEFTLGVDDNCNPIFAGDSTTLMDDELSDIDAISKRMVSQCKRGFK